MDLDPTIGRPGTSGPARIGTALATDARRGVTPPEIEREAVGRTTEHARYGSPGLRPAGDAGRDVVVHLSPKALALAKSASNAAPRARSVDDDGEESEPREARRKSATGGEEAPRSRRRIDARA
ncbi:MAG: hypothetical protein B6D46_09580 [Polyangiaceae bacterium UTPRO1]|jgi:hypothetical protein|nr:hypothetical protein [Myxococcales bacterium]OQY66698.1 MAG: hypothetical protein B6D46_09580 [Polyangiaceae bacterium UTPRO1]